MLHKRDLSWNFAVFLRFSEVVVLRLAGILPRSYGCCFFHHGATAVGNFAMVPKLSGVSPWRYMVCALRGVVVVID